MADTNEKTEVNETAGDEKKTRKAPVRKPILIALGVVKSFATQSEAEKWLNGEEGQQEYGAGNVTIIKGGTAHRPKPVAKLKLR